MGDEQIDHNEPTRSENEPTRIAVFVSGGGTNLQALIDASARGEIPDGRIDLVISSNAQAYACERASRAGIPARVVVPWDYPDRSAWESALRVELEDAHIQMIILAGWMQILSANFVSHYQNRIINIHPSLIPSFCGPGYYGLHVHEAALARGVKVTGATVHFVTDIADGGPIIAQKAVDVADSDTPQSLQRRVMEQAEWILLPQAAQRVAAQIRREM
ncbi:MAG: phosphoribosylglycinamide formyltransferase [Actinomycetaceae bacterium]|nr:phosphoribosylglycinamide formyltransferase [Actinomycetaceae bacterium]MDY6083353.1 phosphoribosylglycinamide formyltransferase [Actinomycetaceae bacterium]